MATNLRDRQALIAQRSSYQAGEKAAKPVKPVSAAQAAFDALKMPAAIVGQAPATAQPTA